MESLFFIACSPLLFGFGALLALGENPLGWVFLAFAPLCLLVGLVEDRRQWRRWPD